LGTSAASVGRSPVRLLTEIDRQSPFHMTTKCHNKKVVLCFLRKGVSDEGRDGASDTKILKKYISNLEFGMLNALSHFFFVFSYIFHIVAVAYKKIVGALIRLCNFVRNSYNVFATSVRRFLYRCVLNSHSLKFLEIFGNMQRRNLSRLWKLGFALKISLMKNMNKLLLKYLV
jgi:hypothetical protein